jgi:hypothetical protein
MPPWRAPLLMLRNPSLQEELELTADQKGQLDQVLRQVGERFQGEGQALQALEPAQRREKMQDLTHKVAEEAAKSLAPLLQPVQQQRLREIQLQMRGPQAFSDPAVHEALKLTAEQIQQMTTLAESMRKEIQGLFSGGGAGSEARGKVTSIRTAYVEKFIALLTDEQKAAWQTMTGKPFQPKTAPASSGGGFPQPGFDSDF